MNPFIVAVVTTILTASAGAEAAICDGRLLATVEQDGSISAGSIERLRARATAGDQLRVGWEVGRPGVPPIVTHWQAALFVTVFEDQVFAQVGGVRQLPEIGSGKIAIPPGRWDSLLSSDGRLLTRVSDRADPIEQRVRSHWCLER